jgi:hypothetical protein
MTAWRIDFQGWAACARLMNSITPRINSSPQIIVWVRFRSGPSQVLVDRLNPPSVTGHWPETQAERQLS